MSENKRVADGNAEAVALIVGRGFSIGFVDEIHGRGALEVPEFIPSRYEVLELVKHWEKVALDDTFFFHRFQQSSSEGTRERVFAHMRINRIAEALKDEAAVQKAIDEAVAEFGADKDDLAWRTFIGTATPEEEAKFEAERDAMLSGEGEVPPVTA